MSLRGVSLAPTRSPDEPSPARAQSTVQADAVPTARAAPWSLGSARPIPLRFDGRGGGPIQTAAILGLQRTHGNCATTRLLRAASVGATTVQPIAPAPVRPPAADHGTAAVVQRDIGFEFEDADASSFRLLTPLTGAQLAQPPHARTIPAAQRDQLPKGHVIQAGTGFELQADLLDSSLDQVTGKPRTDLEFVTTHFPETDSGLSQLKTTMAAIVALRGQLKALPQRDYVHGRFTWPDELQAIGINRTDILTAFTDFMDVVKMQVTGAIRLDQIPELMDMMVAKYSPATGPQTKDDRRRRAGHGVLIRQGGLAAKQVGAAPAAADAGIRGFLLAHSTNDPDVRQIKLTETGNLKGLLSLIVHFLKMADGFQSYPKAASPIMARTDFAQMFQLLPRVQQLALAKNGQQLWLDLVGRALGGAYLQEQIFPPVPAGTTPRPFHIELTREDWLKGMATGTDLLTVDAYKNLAFREYIYGRNPDEERLVDKLGQAKELQGLGGLGGKTEQVGPGIAAPIFELRSLSNNATAGEFSYAEISDVAVKIFKLIRNLNKLKDKTYGE